MCKTNIFSVISEFFDTRLKILTPALLVVLVTNIRYALELDWGARWWWWCWGWWQWWWECQPESWIERHQVSQVLHGKTWAVTSSDCGHCHDHLTCWCWRWWWWLPCLLNICIFNLGSTQRLDDDDDVEHTGPRLLFLKIKSQVSPWTVASWRN